MTYKQLKFMLREGMLPPVDSAQIERWRRDGENVDVPAFFWAVALIGALVFWGFVVLLGGTIVLGVIFLVWQFLYDLVMGVSR